MKTFQQFVEQMVGPGKAVGPSKTPATDSMKVKHDKEKDVAAANKAEADQERQSREIQQVAKQRSEIERAKKTDKDALLRKSAAAKKEKEKEKQQTKKKEIE